MTSQISPRLGVSLCYTLSNSSQKKLICGFFREEYLWLLFKKWFFIVTRVFFADRWWRIRPSQSDSYEDWLCYCFFWGPVVHVRGAADAQLFLGGLLREMRSSLSLSKDEFFIVIVTLTHPRLVWSSCLKIRLYFSLDKDDNKQKGILRSSQVCLHTDAGLLLI